MSSELPVAGNKPGIPCPRCGSVRTLYCMNQRHDWSWDCRDCGYLFEYDTPKVKRTPIPFSDGMVIDLQALTSAVKNFKPNPVRTPVLEDAIKGPKRTPVL